MVEKRGTLDGRFSNVRRIGPLGGGGHFSLVFLAYDNQTGVEVVLKFFRPDRYTPGDAYRWQCFERESQILQKLVGTKDIITLVAGQSQFIECPVPGVPFEITFAYYALEKAEGSLEDLLASGKCSVEDLLIAFRTLVRGIQRIHSMHIAHRDFKPGNVLVTKAGLKISDFGTARLIGDATPALLTVYAGPPGDLEYVSPEMMASLHDVDPKFGFLGDIFSLGAILFEMFTGVKFGIYVFGPQLLTSLSMPMINVVRDQRVAVFNQVIGSLVARFPLPALESLNPDVPPCIRQRLNTLFQDLCALDHRKRLNSFPAILEELILAC